MKNSLIASCGLLVAGSCTAPDLCAALEPVYWKSRETAAQVIALDRDAAEGVAVNNAVMEGVCPTTPRP